MTPREFEALIAPVLRRLDAAELFQKEWIERDRVAAESRRLEDQKARADYIEEQKREVAMRFRVNIATELLAAADVFEVWPAYLPRRSMDGEMQRAAIENALEVADVLIEVAAAGSPSEPAEPIAENVGHLNGLVINLGDRLAEIDDEVGALARYLEGSA